MYFLLLVILQRELNQSFTLTRTNVCLTITMQRMPNDHNAVFPIFGAAAPQIAMLPLVTILTLTAIKDGVEDYRRNELDNGVNNSAVTRLGDWKNVNAPINTKSWWEFWKPSDRAGISRGVRKLRQKEGQYDASFLHDTSTDDVSTDFLPNATSKSTLKIIPSQSEFEQSTSTLYPPSLSPSFSKRHGATRALNSKANWERTLWYVYFRFSC